MHHTLALTALAAAAFAAAIPEGCSPSYDGEFEITVVKANVSTKRDLSTRQSSCGKEGVLLLKLEDGQLTDSRGRIGYIASNYQFQFDSPAQENADSVDGYSVCKDGSLALGDSSVFYECLSGDFYNLYDRSWASQCEPIHLDIMPCSLRSPGGNGTIPATQIGDGQPQAPSATPRPISQISDGQPQAPSATTEVSTSQIGVPQEPTKNPSPSISGGQPPAPPATAPAITGVPASQAPVATPPVPVSQSTNGQPIPPTPTSRASTGLASSSAVASASPTSTPVAAAANGLVITSLPGAVVAAAFILL